MTNLVVHQPVEITGNLVAHHGTKETPDRAWLQPWFIDEWNAIYERTVKRGEAITFYREIEERRAA